jgi:hypothetical protein
MMRSLPTTSRKLVSLGDLGQIASQRLGPAADGSDS